MAKAKQKPEVERDAERQETTSALGSLQKDVATLVRQLQKLKDQVEEARTTTPATISTLSQFGLAVQKPIPIVIQGGGDNFIASFLDANVNASGDSAQEAFHNLCDVLADKYRLFDSLGPEKLGPEIKRQFGVMREFIDRK